MIHPGIEAGIGLPPGFGLLLFAIPYEDKYKKATYFAFFARNQYDGVYFQGE